MSEVKKDASGSKMKIVDISGEETYKTTCCSNRKATGKIENKL